METEAFKEGQKCTSGRGRWVGRGFEGSQTCEAEVVVEILMLFMRGKGWRECFSSHFCQFNDCMVWLLRFGYSYIKHHSDLDTEYGHSLHMGWTITVSRLIREKWFEVNVFITWEDLIEIWTSGRRIKSQFPTCTHPTNHKSDSDANHEVWPLLHQIALQPYIKLNQTRSEQRSECRLPEEL